MGCLWGAITIFPAKVEAQTTPPNQAGLPPAIQKQLQKDQNLPKFQHKPKKSIYDMADVIAFNGKHTIVPKGGVLFAPKYLRDRIGKKGPQGKFSDWTTFYSENSSWIIIENITLNQASGKDPLLEPRIKAILAANRVVVATLKGNPIGYNGVKIVDPKEPVEKNKP